MRLSLCSATILMAFSLALPRLQADQAKVRPDSKLSELSQGTHLYGIPFDAEALLGKVVVVNIGGG